MATSQYKTLSIKLDEAMERFDAGEYTVEEYEKVVKGLYEEFVELDKNKKVEEKQSLLRNIRFTD
jgi:hypothetical protein